MKIKLTTTKLRPFFGSKPLTASSKPTRDKMFMIIMMIFLHFFHSLNENIFLLRPIKQKSGEIRREKSTTEVINFVHSSYVREFLLNSANNMKLSSHSFQAFIFIQTNTAIYNACSEKDEKLIMMMEYLPETFNIFSK